MPDNQANDQPQPPTLEELIKSNDTAQIEEVFEELPPVEIARLISGTTKSEQIHLLEILGPEESAIGLVNGLVLGLLLGAAAFLWKGNPWLGLIVGGALAANTLLAVSFGGLVPLILRGLRTDPALASGPLLTTVTDMCGFFFVLSFASILLPRLAG